MPNLPSTLPAKLIEALKARAVIPFVGAGVSRAVTGESGQYLFPTWREFLLAAAEALRAENLTTKANRVQATLEDNEYLDAARVARDALGALWFDFLKAQFDPDVARARPASLDVARAVWRLGSPLVVTTNYDKVLQWASPAEQDVRQWSVSDRVNMVDIQRDSVEQPTVWHLHGFIDRPEEIILTPDGYNKLYPTNGQIQTDYEAALVTLRHLLTARTFLFIGFGMEEAIRQQIRWVRETFAGAGGKHFVLVRAKDQEAMEKELQGLSVQPIPFADFGPPLLDLLGDLARHADEVPRVSAPLPPVEADPRPYLESWVVVVDRTFSAVSESHLRPNFSSFVSHASYRMLRIAAYRCLACLPGARRRSPGVAQCIRSALCTIPYSRIASSYRRSGT